MIKKKILQQRKLRIWKKITNSNLLVKVGSKNMPQTLNANFQQLNTSKGVIRSRYQTLVTPEEIRTPLGKQGITHYERIIIKKVYEEIRIHIYILTFTKYQFPKMLKLEIPPKKVECIFVRLKNFRYQRHGNHCENWRGHLKYGGCGQKRTQTIYRTIVMTKPNAQTAMVTIPRFQHRVQFTKE